MQWSLRLGDKASDIYRRRTEKNKNKKTPYLLSGLSLVILSEKGRRHGERQGEKSVEAIHLKINLE